jgi:ribonuclease VapC
MIIVDTSALFAILAQEPEQAAFVEAIGQAPAAVTSVASLLELTMVWAGRQPDAPADVPDKLLAALDIKPAEVSAEQMHFAREAFLRFGRGRHPAGLNFGDCFAYALARSLDAPLLFKGDNFSQTDMRSAVARKGTTE